MGPDHQHRHQMHVVRTSAAEAERPDSALRKQRSAWLLSTDRAAQQILEENKYKLGPIICWPIRCHFLQIPPWYTLNIRQWHRLHAVFIKENFSHPWLFDQNIVSSVIKNTIWTVRGLTVWLSHQWLQATQIIMKAYCENKQNLWITVMLWRVLWVANSFLFMVRLMPSAFASEFSHEMGLFIYFFIPNQAHRVLQWPVDSSHRHGYRCTPNHIPGRQAASGHLCYEHVNPFSKKKGSGHAAISVP